jgi:hypothetical protein
MSSTVRSWCLTGQCRQGRSEREFEGSRQFSRPDDWCRRAGERRDHLLSSVDTGLSGPVTLGLDSAMLVGLSRSRRRRQHGQGAAAAAATAAPPITERLSPGNTLTPSSHQAQTGMPVPMLKAYKDGRPRAYTQHFDIYLFQHHSQTKS